MPMALPIIAPMIASALGSTLLPAVAGSSLLGIGTSTLGGVLGGALAGGLTNENDPLLGAVLGGVGGGLGGPGLAEGAGSLFSGATDLISGAGSAAATAAPEALGAAGHSLGGTLATEAASAAAPVASAASVAAPVAAGQAISDGAFAPLESSTLTGLEASDPLLGGGGDALFNSGTAAGQIGALDAAPAVGGGAAGTVGAGAADIAGGATAPTNSFLTALEDPSLENILGAIDTNKDILGAGFGLGTAAFQPSTLPGEDELASLAANLKQQGGANMGYLNSGTLPAGLEGSLRSSSEAAKAAVRSMFASRGMSGSSSEVQTLANIDQTRAEQGAQIATKLLEQGVNQSQISSRLYDIILRNAMAKDQALGSSIARFATALAA